MNGLALLLTSDDLGRSKGMATLVVDPDHEFRRFLLEWPPALSVVLSVLNIERVECHERSKILEQVHSQHHRAYYHLRNETKRNETFVLIIEQSPFRILSLFKKV